MVSGRARQLSSNVYISEFEATFHPDVKTDAFKRVKSGGPVKVLEARTTHACALLYRI